MIPTLRPYQESAASAALDSIERGKNGIVAIPSGAGKSLVIADLATKINGGIVVLQPTKEILEQNFNKLHEFGCQDVEIFSASCGRKKKARITLATIGSIIKRLDWFMDVGLVIIDEVHLCNAKQGQYKELIETIGKPVLGLTATPYRMHASMGGMVVQAKFLHRTRPRIFDHICYIAQPKTLHQEGWLSPIAYDVNADYDPNQVKLKSTGLNYDEEALEAYNAEKGISVKAVNAVIENLSDVKHFLIFASSIKESRTITGMLNAAGISARHVDGTTPKDEREQALEDFKAGYIKAVSNCMVFSIGYDFPALDGIVLARPTMSLPLFLQQYGRGVRISPGKEVCRIFDLCGNVRRFGEPDKYSIAFNDKGLHRLECEGKYLTGINFVTGRDLEKQASRRASKKKQDYTLKKQDYSLNGPSNGSTIVTFGIHTGKSINQIPLKYVKWCAETFRDGKWKTAFFSEFNRRKSLTLI